MQWNDSYQEKIFCFTNNIPQRDGGTHLAGFRSALTRTLNQYMDSNGLTQKAKVEPTGDDVREGLTAVLSVKVADPKFSSQPRTNSSRPKSSPQSSPRSGRNSPSSCSRPRTRRAHCGQDCRGSPRAREAARKARGDDSAQDGTGCRGVARQACRLPGKGSQPVGVVPRRGRLGGRIAKQGRDRRFQAILPLKGKI